MHLYNTQTREITVYRSQIFVRAGICIGQPEHYIGRYRIFRLGGLIRLPAIDFKPVEHIK